MWGGCIQTSVGRRVDVLVAQFPYGLSNAIRQRQITHVMTRQTFQESIDARQMRNIYICRMRGGGFYETFAQASLVPVSLANRTVARNVGF